MNQPRRWHGMRLSRILLILGVLAITILWLVPEGYTLFLSVTGTRPALEGGGVYLTLSNVRSALGTSGLARFYLNSVLVTGATVVIVTLFASLCAYSISRLRFPGATALYAALLVGLMLPETAFAVPFYQLLKHFDLLDNYFGLILPYAALEMPFALVIMKSFFDEFPVDIEEAAWVDGAGRLASFSRVVLPNFVAPIVVVIVFTFLFSWNEFLLALIVMTDNAMKTVALAPLAFQGVYQSDEGTLIASLVLVSLPVVVLYFAVQRFIDIGVSSGAVKG